MQHHLTLVHFSGAFSDVYKALDLTTGRKVAGACPAYFVFHLRNTITVKVVRKYELSASQVCDTCFVYIPSLHFSVVDLQRARSWLGGRKAFECTV